MRQLIWTYGLKKMVEVPEHEVSGSIIINIHKQSRRIIQAWMPMFHLAAIASHCSGTSEIPCISMIIYASLVSLVVEGC